MPARSPIHNSVTVLVQMCVKLFHVNQMYDDQCTITSPIETQNSKFFNTFYDVFGFWDFSMFLAYEIFPMFLAFCKKKCNDMNAKTKTEKNTRKTHGMPPRHDNPLYLTQ
jgi:hypothetical protein